MLILKRFSLGHVVSILLNYFFYVICAGKPRNMFIKILIFKCYIKTCHEEREEYVTKLSHFHCKCKEKHLLLICFYENHPYSSDMLDLVEKECKCSSVSSIDYCDFCGWVSWLLNLKTYKVCLKRIPQSLKDGIINTHQYYEKLKCAPFLRYNNNTHSFKVFLDNLQEPIIPKVVD